MITYIKRKFSCSEVEATISIYSVPGKVSEYHVAFDAYNNLIPFEEQLKNIINAYKELIYDEWKGKVVPVFCRYFLSDAANQTALLHDKLKELPPSAVSIVQQPSLHGAKVNLWVYLLDNSVEISASDRFLSVAHNSYKHYWTGNRKVNSGNSEFQTHRLLEQYEQDLKDMNCTIADNCLRTWFFVQNVDVNYMGLVKARRENFRVNGLTEQTHYITSTGIEGRDEDPAVHVLLDAYSVDGICPEQIKYLQAQTHLSPTHVYGVTFERGVSVLYGDRKQIYISGTASIDNKGKVVHAGDIINQAERMLENVQQLLHEGGATFDDVMYIIVYLRDGSDIPNILEIFYERFRKIPTHFVLAPVCRPAWLVEMECIAVIPSENTTYDDF